MNTGQESKTHSDTNLLGAALLVQQPPLELLDLVVLRLDDDVELAGLDLELLHSGVGLASMHAFCTAGHSDLGAH